MAPRDSSASYPDLIARCALGDEAAFVSLYDAAAPKLYGIALRILKREAWAEEALQESFMKIWRRADSYDRAKGTAITWMINIVRNQALDLLRRTDYRVEEVAWSAETDPRESRDDPARQAEIHADLERVLRCLEALPEKHRQCILLVYHQGLTAVDVARRLDVPAGTVKTWIRRGVMRVRECLRR